MTIAEDRDPVPATPPVLELPRFCLCGKPHPCFRCWPDKTPPGLETLQLTLDLD